MRRGVDGMKWRKQGLIYVPNGDMWWAKSHAYLPTAEVLGDEYIRVYFASLDENKFGRIGYVNLNINNPAQVLFSSQEPILDLGDFGTFDDSGVSPSCIINIEQMKYLYYVGWQRAERVPYMLFAGIAISNDSGHSFQRHSSVPILERTASEPFIRSATTIIKDEGFFKMWYVSALSWVQVDGKMLPSYILRYAESEDGLNWGVHDKICINFENEDEFGFGRPWVVKDNDTYKMWYSIRSRSRSYRIGYAESGDGINWVRKDNEVGIEASMQGWDSEMICFPCVIDAKGKRYMFYNGNRHGATGFGYAILES